jgi:hypothetical protein
LGLACARDAMHHGVEYDRRDDHPHKPDEKIAEWFQRVSASGPEPPPPPRRAYNENRREAANHRRYRGTPNTGAIPITMIGTAITSALAKFTRRQESPGHD